MEQKDTIVFAFGRFNPPTVGHEKLIKKVAQVAGSNPFRIYPSFTTKPKTDPLPHSLKVAYMRKMFKKYAKNIIADKDAKTAIMIAEKIFKEGFKNLVMVAGSDRVREFSTLLNRYNDAPDKKGNQLFKFDSVKVVSAGERDPDAEGVEGMSASKMRVAAANSDFDSFKQGIPATLSDADKKKLYFDVRKYMGIREERDMGDLDEHEALRDAYLTGKIWNVGDIVEARGWRGEIVRKGTNYLSFVIEDGKVHKAWLHEIIIDEGFASDAQRRAAFAQGYKAKGKKGKKEEIEIDELSSQIPWLNKAVAKVDQILHPRGYEEIVKRYVEMMKDAKNRKMPSRAAAELARGYRGVNARDLIKYINTLVDKGELPKELKAEYVPEHMSFKDLVNQIQEGAYGYEKQDPDIKDRKGTQPAKYFRGLSPSTKRKRDAHFKAKRSGPAPGDKEAKTKPSIHTKKFKQMYGESRAKKAVAGGKVQKLVTAHGLKFKGKVYKEIDMELVSIDNSTQMVTFNIIHPKEIFGNEVKLAFKVLRRGPFMATDTSKINERKLTDKELKRREEIAKDLPDDEFKDRYGKDWMSVKMATATKMAKNEMKEEPRIPRKKGQPAGSDKHSDLYTDENPKGTIHGLGFKDVETAKKSVKKIEGSGKTHAHKIQAAIAMEQRARVMGKKAEAGIYRAYIEKMKKITKQKQQKESKHNGKCPPGYRYDEKLKSCVPKKGLVYRYPFLGRTKNSSNQDAQDDSDQNANGSNGNGNGQNTGNGGNGNNQGGNGNNQGGNGGGSNQGETYLAADVRKMPGGGYGVYADKFVKGKRVMTPGGKHKKELKKVYKNKKDANDYMAAIMIAKGGG